MRIQSSFTGRSILLLLAILGAAQLACVGGHIPPSMFEFTNVVPYTGPREGDGRSPRCSSCWASSPPGSLQPLPATSR